MAIPIRRKLPLAGGPAASYQDLGQLFHPAMATTKRDAAGSPKQRRRHPSSSLSRENRRMAGSGPSCRMAGGMHRDPLNLRGKSPLHRVACTQPLNLGSLHRAQIGHGLAQERGETLRRRGWINHSRRQTQREFLLPPGVLAGRPQFPVLEGSQHAQDLRGRAYPQVLVAGMMLIMVRRAGTAKVWAGSPQQARLCRVSAARGYPGGWLARARSDSFAG